MKLKNNENENENGDEQWWLNFELQIQSKRVQIREKETNE